MAGETAANSDSQKKLLTAAGLVVVLIILGAAYWYWQSRRAELLPDDKTVDTAEKVLESTGAGTVPAIDPLSNPLERAPNVNPVEKTNPFRNLKTNPFE